MTTPKFPSSFEPIENAGPKFPSSFEPIKNEPSPTFKGAVGSYATGVGGGAGGLLGDIAPFLGVAGTLLQGAGLKSTPEQTQALAKEFGVQQPQNALERILQTSGEFGGQEALIGTGLGGPVGAGAGLAHGSASGAFYGGLKELGVSNEWALGATALATLSPIAANKLFNKLKADKGFKAALSEVEKNIGQAPPPGAEGNLPTPPDIPPSPPLLPPSGIKPGMKIPETISQFGEKEQILNKLAERPNPPPLSAEIKIANTKAEAPSLQGRVSEAKPLGEVISKEGFETEAQATRQIAKDVTEARNAERDVVKDKYKAAEEITQGHTDYYPELAKENDARIAKLEELEKRSAGEEAVYQDALALRKMIGEENGLLDANASRIMKQANSFSQKVKYELPYAGYKGEIKNIVHQMNQAVLRSLEAAGINAAPVREADRAFARFADRFMSDELVPYLSKKIQNPEQLARKAVSDEATHRAIKDALGSRKVTVINKIDREIVEQTMDKYFKDPLKVNSKEYVKDLKNLAERIGKEKVAEVDLALRERQIAHERNLRKQNKVRETELATSKEKPPPLNITKKPIAETPEQLDKLFTVRSDIRRLKRTMLDAGMEKEYEKLVEKELENIFKEGKFGEHVLTGQDLERIIDKKHEILNELIGEQEVSLLYKAARKAGKEELTREIIKDVAKAAGKTVLNLLGLGKLIKLIPLKHI